MEGGTCAGDLAHAIDAVKANGREAKAMKKMK